MQTSSERPLAIEAIKLHKDYHLGELPDIVRLLRRRTSRKSSADRSLLPALDGVSFQLEVGECLALMGSNGSGKSTLASLIAGITAPTGGRLRVRGRVLPLLEVGAVFHEELTGRENVLLFGTILGIPRSEVRAAMGAIAEFGGIDEQHMDTPLKRYSTGMRARLSFAVAMRFAADIYIFDEVVAVVDDDFRARAVREIEALLGLGRTVIFISHDLDLVRKLCTQGMWLRKGRIQAYGEVGQVANEYVRSQAAGALTG